MVMWCLFGHVKVMVMQQSIVGSLTEAGKKW